MAVIGQVRVRLVCYEQNAVLDALKLSREVFLVMVSWISVEEEILRSVWEIDHQTRPKQWELAEREPRYPTELVFLQSEQFFDYSTLEMTRSGWEGPSHTCFLGDGERIVEPHQAL